MYKAKSISKGNKKAVSEIVAVIMLMLIAIASSVLIYLWLTSLIGSVHANNPTLYEKIQITSVSIYPGYNITAYVENTGSIKVTISSLSVINANNGNALFVTTSFESSSTNTISPGNVGKIVTTSTPSISSGTPVIIQVTTSNGVIATYQTTWP